MRAFFVFTTVALLTSISQAQNPCPAASISIAVQGVKAAQAAALGFKAASMDSGVARGVAPKLIRLKETLATLLDKELACHRADEPIAQLQRRIDALLTQAAPNQPESPDSSNDKDFDKPLPGLYGNNVSAHLELFSGPPKLLKVVVTSSVVCGDDAQLLVYEIGNGHWTRALRASSNLDNPHGFSWGDFFLTAIVTDAVSGQWRAVVAHGTPWCSSRMSGFGMAVFAPSDTPNSTPFWQIDREYSRGDFNVRLKAKKDTFELRLNADEMRFDPDDAFERTVIYRYQVSDLKVTRLEPVATTGRGFVEEWISMPWEEALAQSAAEDSIDLRAIHKLEESNAAGDLKSYVSWNAGPVLACAFHGDFQVAFTSQRENLENSEEHGPLVAHYFRIRQVASGYQMVSVSAKPDANCSGPDLMAKSVAK